VQGVNNGHWYIHLSMIMILYDLSGELRNMADVTARNAVVYSSISGRRCATEWKDSHGVGANAECLRQDCTWVEWQLPGRGGWLKNHREVWATIGCTIRRYFTKLLIFMFNSELESGQTIILK